MRRRKFIIPLAVLAVAIAIALAVLLRKTAPPEPVRLLPEAQAYLYLDLSPLRAAGLLEKMPPVQLDPEYDKFVKETGFQFERDLEEAAIAVHEQPPAAPGPNEKRYSEVIVAKFDGQRARDYLKKVAQSIDTYHEREIYNVPREDRIVHVCILGPDLVAVSNANDPTIIRGIISRYRKLALPFGGPKLVREHYSALPFGTLSWAIADVGEGSTTNTALVLPGGYDLFFPPNTVMVASLRYLGSIDLKVRAITSSDDAARRITDQLSAFLAVFRTLELSAGGPDPDVKAFFDSIKVQQDGKSARLSADLPKGFLQKMLTEPPPEIQPATPPEAKKPQPKKHPKRHHK